MAGVLDLLQAYLQQGRVSGAAPPGQQDYPAYEAMMQQALQRQQQNSMAAQQQRFAGLPPGLPAPVARSIVDQPSYGEGDRPMGGAVPGMGQEVIDNILAGSPQRDAYLAEQLAQARENQWRQRLGLPVGGSATQFASPLNQMMPRWGRQSMGL